MTTNPRPENVPVPCRLPAVGAYVAYRRDPGTRGPETMATFPFCRLHERAQAAAAARAANGVELSDEYYGAFPVEYEPGQSRVACTGERTPLELAAALDAEWLTAAATDARAALRRLTALTTIAYGDSFEIGNEGAVLQELLELLTDVEEEAGVVARRLSARHPARWFRVAEVVGNIRSTDSRGVRLSVATRFWQRWGGGLVDDVAPVLEGTTEPAATS